MNANGKCVIFSGPSGAGKTSLVQHLLSADLGLTFSISACSRERRANESNGVDYFFFSVEEFKNKINAGQFIEWEEVYPNQFYGTLKSEIERIWSKGNAVIFDVDVQGGIKLKSVFKQNALSVFVNPPSIEKLKERLISRKTENQDSLEKRIKKAQAEIALSGEFDKIIDNNQLSAAKAEAEELVKSFLKQNA